MPPNEVTLELLDYRVTVLEEDRRKFLAALETLVLLGATIGETQRTMVEQNKNATQLGEWLQRVDSRVQSLEVARPMLEMTSHWVRIGVLGVLSLVGMGLYGMYESYRVDNVNIERATDAQGKR